MIADNTLKTCLIVTYGPVPTPQYQTVEGGGMRAWGLAKGLQTNGTKITIAVNNSFPQELNNYKDIDLVNWGLDDQFAEFLNTFDAVVVSYCMGDASVFIADRINNDVQLILDAYVPIYIEVSARDSKNVEIELKNYLADIQRFNHVLRRGDYFLCANDSQKTLYLGVLSSLGVVNPRSYRQERILITPFGIHDEPIDNAKNPYTKLGIKAADFVVLWFGGLYPWFRVDELLGAIQTLSRNKSIKFVFVGGKNPFNPNPDFTKQYDRTVDFAKEHGYKNDSVFFIDWVEYNDRINWYSGADVVISLNQPGEENGFSWRTRVMDFVWGEIPVLTNGGDPLSETLLEKSAAVRLDSLSSKNISQVIEDLQSNKDTLKKVTENIRALKSNYYWENILKPLSDIIRLGSLPYNDELLFKQQNGIEEVLAGELVTADTSRRSVIGLTRKAISQIRKKGLRSSSKVMLSIARTQVKKAAPSGRARKYVFIGHPIDNTGAPLVLIQIMKEFANAYGAKNVHLITPHILPEHRQTLHKLGVQVDKSAHALSFRMIRLQLGLSSDDFVMMNTIAIYDNYREFILLWLRIGRLKHAYWFIHEDKDQIPVVNHTFLESATVNKIQSLCKDNKLSILVPSERVRIEYNKILQIKSTRVVPLRVSVDKKYTHKRQVGDYKKIDFLISGTPSDGRKGQMIALAAFSYFFEHYYTKSPASYRDFGLHLISIGNDYLSQQIRWVGDSILKDRVTFYPSMPRSEALEVTAACNAVICCSLNETFALYVAEGMLMGHVVLRNDSAGIDEQLQDGKNGYFIDHTNITQFAGVLEKLLNKKTTSDEALQKMGALSQKIINDYSQNSYIDTILLEKD
jgi:glycosyltransferase involved in cell wall biosynthesis